MAEHTPTSLVMRTAEGPFPMETTYQYAATPEVAAHFAPVAEAFRPHLEATLPHVAFPVIAWRVRWCLFGTLGALLVHASAPFERDANDLIADLVAVLSAALAA